MAGVAQPTSRMMRRALVCTPHPLTRVEGSRCEKGDACRPQWVSRRYATQTAELECGLQVTLGVGHRYAQCTWQAVYGTCDGVCLIAPWIKAGWSQLPSRTHGSSNILYSLLASVRYMVCLQYSPDSAVWLVRTVAVHLCDDGCMKHHHAAVRGLRSGPPAATPTPIGLDMT